LSSTVYRNMFRICISFSILPSSCSGSVWASSKFLPLNLPACAPRVGLLYWDRKDDNRNGKKKTLVTSIILTCT
jgi:hypothetical protein